MVNTANLSGPPTFPQRNTSRSDHETRSRALVRIEYVSRWSVLVIAVWDP